MRESRRVLRGLAAVVAAVALALGPVAPAAAADPVTETVLTLDGTPEPDGTAVTLDVSLLTTDASEARPAIVLAHGFGGTKADSLATAQELARDGYAVITFTARGFGRSGGRIHLDNPSYEGADARKLIDLAATRPEVQSTDGDPVIGFAGGSYGGAISLVVAGLDPRVDAIAPAFTWNSLSQALFPQYASKTAPTSLAGLDEISTTGVFKQRWASLFFLGGGASAGEEAGPAGGDQTGGDPAGGKQGGDKQAGDDPGLCGRFTAALCRGYLATAESGRPDPDLVELLDESTPDLSAITAPTLLVQGEDDTLFPLDHADSNLRGLPTDTPARMVWVAGGHDTMIDLDALLPELESWFGRYLKKDGSAPDTGFTVTVPETSLVGTDGGGQNDDPPKLNAATYPGRGTPLATRTVALEGEGQSMISPPGGTPAALTNLPGTGGALRALASVGGYALGVLPGQSATFTTAPVTEPVVLVGSGSVNLRVTASESTATLFVSVWDLGPDTTTGGPDTAPGTASGATTGVPGTAVLPGLGLAPVRLTGLKPRTPQEVIVTLPPVAHQVPVGHRMQVVVSSTDQAYAVPSRAVVYGVDLVGDRALVLPVLDASPSSRGLDVPLPLVIVVSALALAAIVALILLAVRRRSAHPRVELLGVPLVVEDLVKTYGDGFKAVDGVSFRAEAGQVVGLLGPNGAGKTTTMRMLVGLIRPDAGTVFVEGQPVHAGADVLGAVGSFIEGPGFLPHLTGSENLDAYWQATGRPQEDAHLEEALEIAGLGAALDRKVRGYSQGMRQRLGIAQAMLGLPSLLLLDEPTNGLDPPQIRAMRQVLADYAAGGRTVVVSSHLLSEVEQTCSHVVVMHRGKVILTGSMDELTATDDVTLIGLDRRGDIEAARATLEALGVDTVIEHGLIRVTGDLPRATLVAALVDGGHPIESVDGRRQLEEVFMSLVGTPSSGNTAAPAAAAAGASS